MHLIQHNKIVEKINVSTFDNIKITNQNIHKLDIHFDQIENMKQCEHARHAGTNCYHHFDSSILLNLKHLNIVNNDKTVKIIYFLQTGNVFNMYCIGGNPSVLACSLPKSIKTLLVTGANVWFARAYRIIHLKRLNIDGIAIKPSGLADNNDMLIHNLPSLKHLQLRNHYKGEFSPFLKSLRIDYHVFDKINWSHTLKKLHIHSVWAHDLILPSHLKVLFIHHLKTYATHADILFEWPLCLRKLTIWKFDYQIGISNLPSTLKTLRLNSDVSHHLKLPTRLEKLIMPLYTGPLNLHDKPCLKHLQVFKLNESLPESIRVLHVTFCECQLMNLPFNLRELIICNYAFDLPHLPDHVKYVHLANYDKPIPYLPSTLKTLIIPQVRHRLPTPLPSRLSHVVMAHQ